MTLDLIAAFYCKNSNVEVAAGRGDGGGTVQDVVRATLARGCSAACMKIDKK